LRWVDFDVDRARWRATGAYRLLHTLQVGVEYNIAAQEVAPLATWFLMTEDDRRPAVFLGTSSDRIGSPEGTQSYYLTAAKAFPIVRVAPYVTVNYSEWDDGWNVPFGANVDLGRGFSLQPMYDGDRGHLTGSWSNDRMSVTALWVWFEHFGLAAAVGF
jgi:hypothetical protein